MTEEDRTRIGVVIWPDAATQVAIDDLRRRYDAHYQLIGPHITISFPDEQRTSWDEIKDLVAQAAARVSPFEVHLARWVSIADMLVSHPDGTRYLIKRYPNAANAIFLLAEAGTKEMLRLRRYLSSAIEQPPLLLPYPPYLTLGQTLSDADYEAARAELVEYCPDYRFTVTSIDLLAEQKDGSWIVEATYSLGQ